MRCPWSAYKCLRNGQSLRREESPSRFCNNPTKSYRNFNNPISPYRHSNKNKLRFTDRLPMSFWKPWLHLSPRKNGGICSFCDFCRCQFSSKNLKAVLIFVQFALQMFIFCSFFRLVWKMVDSTPCCTWDIWPQFIVRALTSTSYNISWLNPERIEREKQQQH